jgi:hypothetical protein
MTFNIKAAALRQKFTTHELRRLPLHVQNSPELLQLVLDVTVPLRTALENIADMTQDERIRNTIERALR